MPSKPHSPAADLGSLDRVVSTWSVSGEAERTVTYEWTTGRFFLLQHVNLGGTEGLKVIGHERRYGKQPKQGHQIALPRLLRGRDAGLRRDQ